MRHVAGLYHVITVPTRAHDNGRECISDSGARFGFQMNSNVNEIEYLKPFCKKTWEDIHHPREAVSSTSTRLLLPRS